MKDANLVVQSGIRTREEGYLRVAGPKPDAEAVVWWYVATCAGDPFARGGRCATARAARHLIDDARAECAREAALRGARPTHRLDKKGELVPL